MKTSILFLLPLLILGGCGENLSREYKGEDGLRPSFIVGGEEVKTTAEGGNPFGAVVLLVKKDGGMCSGTLNTPTEISTAAHCFLRMSLPNEKDRTIIQENIKQIVHEQYPGKKVESIPPREIEPYMVKAIRTYMKQKALNTAIYFGNDPNSATGQDFIYARIQDIKGQQGWIDVFMSKYFAPIASLDSSSKPYDLFRTKEIENDRITLVLESPVFIEETRPIPWIKKDEWTKLPQNIHIFVVGFGRTIDPRIYAGLKKDLGDSYFQHKKVVSLEVQNILGNVIVLRSKDQKKAEGTCDGDSGGPFLVRLENGEFRQIAVTSMTMHKCGHHTFGSGFIDLYEMKELLQHQ